MLGAMLLLGACAGNREHFRVEWQVPHGHHRWIKEGEALILTDPDSQTVHLIHPAALKVFEARKGDLLRERFNYGGNRVSRRIAKVSGGVLPKDLQRFEYLWQPEGLLEFSYTPTGQRLALIDPHSLSRIWTNDEVTWSLDRYQGISRAITRTGLALLGQSWAEPILVPVAEGLFPKRSPEEATLWLPEQGALLVRDYRGAGQGIACLGIADGRTRWRTATGFPIAAFLADEPGRNLYVIGGNPAVTEDIGHLAQGSRDILRISTDSGSIALRAAYSRNLVRKLPGGFVTHRQELRDTDIRLVDNMLLLNFNATALYDTTDGRSLLQAESERDVALNWRNDAVSNFFAAPVVKDGVLYRTFTSRLIILERRFAVEAIEIASGQRIWISEEFEDPVFALAVQDDLVLAGFGGKTGTAGLSRLSGDTQWRVPMTWEGHTAPWALFPDRLFSVEGSVIQQIALPSGRKSTDLDVGTDIGEIREFLQRGDAWYLAGKSKALARFEPSTGTYSHVLPAGFDFRITFDADRVLLRGKAATDPVVLATARDLRPIGRLKADRVRYGLGWDPRSDSLYALRKGKLIRYRPPRLRA